MEELRNPLQKLFSHIKSKMVFKDFFHEVKSHPDYPTLKSISDTLEKFGIDNSPVRIKPEDLYNLDDPFLAYVNNKGHNEFAYVHPLPSQKIKFTTENRAESTVPIDEFAGQFNGIAVLLDLKKAKPSIVNLERSKSQRFFGFLIATIAVSTLTLLAFNFYKSSGSFFVNSTSIVFLTAHLVGLSLAIALVLKGLGESGTLLNKVCRVGKKADCDSVIKSKYSTVYAGIKWSDIGFIYFLIALYLMSVNSMGFVTLMAFVAFPYVFVSLYQQVFLIKKLCPLCLGVVTVLTINFVIALALISDLNLSLDQAFESGLTVALIGVLYLIVKSHIESRGANTVLLQRYNRLKRIPDVIQTVLKREEILVIPEKAPLQSMTFGSNEEDTIRIQALLSLHCGYCANVFKKLDSLLENNNINVALYLSLKANNHSQVSTLENIVNAYYSGHTTLAWSLLRGWYQKPNNSKKTWTGEPNELVKKIVFSTRYIMQSNQISSLPKLFVEGIEKSSHYSLTEYAKYARTVKSLSAIPKREMIINT